MGAGWLNQETLVEAGVHLAAVAGGQNSKSVDTVMRPASTTARDGSSSSAGRLRPELERPSIFDVITEDAALAKVPNGRFRDIQQPGDRPCRER